MALWLGFPHMKMMLVDNIQIFHMYIWYKFIYIVYISIFHIIFHIIYIYIISFIKLPHSGNSTWLWKITKFNMCSVEIVISQFANCKKLLGEHQRVYIYICIHSPKTRCLKAVHHYLRLGFDCSIIHIHINIYTHVRVYIYMYTYNAVKSMQQPTIRGWF